MIELGMHVDNWRHQDAPLKVPCEFAKNHGMKYIELGSVNGDYFVQSLGYNPHVPLHTDPLRLKAYLDSMGLKVSQIDAAYPISFPDGQYRGIPYTIESIKFARAVGAPYVDTTDGATKPAGYTDEEVMVLIKQYYRVILEWAESHDIIINVEPHGPYTTNPDTMERILSMFDSKYLRMNFDTGNTFIAGNDPVKFLERFKHKVTHLHIKDVSASLAKACRGEETGISTSVVAIGEGVNADNIAGCIEVLKKMKWSGVLSIECEAAPGKVEQGLAWLRKELAR
ncbi:MAG TPA: sugar phosphate isomerase/epimerase family protein [Phycisphaerae bacterium]|nr:sugar phosphate isomerase/epimerase family protein [Phycisphaerae bacterium]HRY69416.1 sugar phosphate isomerase/epimerase family protein [Phycisphaerae bacterium]HSA26283.1 sugar phosphate isomerase/epimerase family protein [Phycisphaerae bacterium]